MKSYVRVCGPAIAEALRALGKIAAESPEVLSYCDTLTPVPSGCELLRSCFTSIPVEIPTRREAKLVRLISKGDNDFFFEWARNPTQKELEDLTSRINEALAPLGCKYIIVTK